MESVSNSQICRLCLFKNDSLIYIFEVNFRHGFVAAEVISDLLHYEVSERDGYPQFVCHQCLNQLNEFTIFKRRCNESKAAFDTDSLKEMVLEEEYNPDQEKFEPIQILQEGPSFETNIHPRGNLAPILIKQEVASYETDIHPEVNLEPIVLIKQEVASYVTDIHPEDDITSMKMGKINTEVDTYVQASVSDYLPADRNSQGKGTVHPLLHHTNNISNSIQTDDNEKLVNNGGSRTENKVKWNALNKEKKFSCSECGRSFLNRFYLELHLRIHSNKRPFPCMLCSKRFSQKSSLNLHLRTHSGDRPFPCMQCGYRFSQKHCLIRHLRICKKPENISQTEKNTQNVIENMGASKNIDNVKKMFSCLECDKSFQQSSHLEMHLRKHSGERPFPCMQCDKSFTQKTNLVSHLRTHRDDRPFPCIQCGYRFTQKHCLNRHLRICKKPENIPQKAKITQNVIENMGTKNIDNVKKMFSCLECDKSFQKSAHLKLHLRKHSGERPFSCLQCGKSFTQKTSLTTHMRTHSGDRPYPCMQCGYRFTQKHCLIRHLPVCQKQKIHKI